MILITASSLGSSRQITGAGHGIGRELAVQLASLGCIVVCWDVDVEANRSTISSVSRNGGEVSPSEHTFDRGL